MRDLIKQQAELMKAQQDALNDAPLEEGEYYESDEFYTREIKKIEQLLEKGVK